MRKLNLIAFILIQYFLHLLLIVRLFNLQLINQDTADRKRADGFNSRNKRALESHKPVVSITGIFYLAANIRVL